MTRRILIGILIVVLLAVGAAGVGLTAYRFGFVQGAVSNGQVQVVTAPDGAVNPHMLVYPGGPWGFGGRWGGFGFGFGFLRCLIPLFGLFLLFGLFRLILGPRRWGGWGYRRWGPGGPWGPGGRAQWGEGEHPVPPAFEAWHRQMHGEAAPPPPPPPQPGQ
jgi:hypothetical protein